MDNEMSENTEKSKKSQKDKQKNSLLIDNAKINLDMSTKLKYLVIGLGAFVISVILVLIIYRYKEFMIDEQH